MDAFTNVYLTATTTVVEAATPDVSIPSDTERIKSYSYGWCTIA
ncbi:hypothetical protein MD484_g8153, partial [Candolleomyces efflorescens]